MPLYEYECEACGRRFELIRKFSDPAVETCPHCQSGPVRRLLSAPAIQFKGSGFYITDYPKQSGETKKPEKPKDTKSDESAAPSSAAPDSKSDSTKTESAPKPAAPAPTSPAGTKD